MSNDLTILPPAKDNFKKIYKMDIHKNLPDFHSGVLALVIGIPGGGKTTLLLNLLGRFLKYYYDEIYFIGGAFAFDPTLKSLLEYYGNQSNSCSDTVFNNIIKKRTEMNNDPLKGNACVVVDDLMSLPDFNSRSSTSMARLASIYRHVLGGATPSKKYPNIKRSGGLYVVLNQRFQSSIPRNLRSCCNVIFLGKLSNKEEYLYVIKEYSLMFGGEDNMKEMIKINNSEKFNFLCIYLNGCMNEDITGPCIFLNFTELLFPTERFKKNEMIL